jgi:rhodanese-related sulfurtransferase
MKTNSTINKQSFFKALFIALSAILILNISCAKASKSEIDVKTLNEIIRSGASNYIIVDVRTQNEYTGPLGHIKGSILIPLHTVNANIEKFREFSGRKIYLICRSGNRSSVAQGMLKEAGIKNLFNVAGGMKAWNSAGLSVER